jgi:peroxiredoxin
MTAPPEPDPYPAPLFELAGLDGKEVSLSDFRGKPVLINFWASWCIPCLNEMPFIEKTYRKQKGDGLAVLMLNVKEPSDVVRKFAKDHGYTFTILMDRDGKINNSYQVFGLPSSYFVDRDGIVRYSYMGELTIGIMKMGLKTIMPINPRALLSPIAVAG